MGLVVSGVDWEMRLLAKLQEARGGLQLDGISRPLTTRGLTGYA